MKIAELGLTCHEKNFLEDIFHGEHALLDNENISNFDMQLESLISTWAVLDPSEKFSSYIKTLAPTMKSSMIASVRTQAGLGFPPAKYYTNDAESNNFRLKNWLGFRETSMPKFIEEISSFTKSENADCQKAFCNLQGKYFVRTEFRDLLQCADYRKLSVNQKKNFLKMAMSVSMSELVANSTGPSSFNHSLADSGIISVPYEKAGINVSKYTLKHIWSEGAELVQNSEKVIMPAPCLLGGLVKYSVLRSMRSCDDSQVVTYQVDTAMFNCNCKYYSVHSICSHTVACAEINDHLSSFLKWHSINKKKTNKYKQSTRNLNLRCIGQKGNVQRRTRTKQTNQNRKDKINTSVTESCQDFEKHETHFIFKFLHGTQIRVCYGCRKAIRTPPSVPPPPLDVILAAKVNYSFAHPKTGHLVIKRDWKHFHCKRTCIKDYRHVGVHVCCLIKSRLTQVHWNHINTELGIEIQC